MVDYSKLSDAEIAQKVFFWVSDKICPNGGLAHINKDGFFFFDDRYVKRKFDPCNNPVDAWPIIDDSNIALIPSGGFGWVAVSNLTLNGKSSYIDERLNDCFQCEDGSGLRAAMIVFLMMQDTQNG